ncbi:hypothetical protein SAMN04487989_105101 [Bizionia echini]|uniref:Uncharacterized protein n=1 Tax=Bizionia echini TaxID=649333 RepID=A0A1I5CIT4_9FLAO|nr:hypothetical protein [Bizionia echini]SFN86807.1 hypothetical protein SAMN04487989_105101 [Bizionia echini]
MHLKQSLIIAIAFSFLGLASWELFWRSEGKMPDLDDDKNLWAVQRAKVNKLTKSDVLLMGSSRVLFDIQLNEWESETGVRPIQLASAGASPLPIFHDIVNNTDFNGTVIVGVTPGLFFSTTYPGAGPWKRAQSRVEYYQNRTYAQRLNHWLSLPLQKNLALVSTTEEGWSDDIDLKSLLGTIQLENRLEKPIFPPFYNFGDIDQDRNMQMTQKTVNDTAFANTVKLVWKTIVTSNDQPPEREATTSFFADDAKKFKAKDGNLILVYCPASGLFKEGETKFFKTSEFWDKLILQTGKKGYHYEDYEQLKNLDCPEWSHLSAKDAKYFTTELIKIMKIDGALSHSKTN